MSDEVRCGKITAEVYYEDQGPGARGWIAVYWKDGDVVDDSSKVWHPNMPIRRDAVKKARQVARRYACWLSKQEE